MESKFNSIDDTCFNHAWNWFNLHAAQRMQTFNYFLVATAFLIAAYASLIERVPLAALAVALVGAWISFWFTRLDNRTRQLINAGEDVLKIYQKRIAKSIDLPEFEILRIVEGPGDRASSYRLVIGVIQRTIVTVFLFAGAYASFRL
jgi:hypothetical protein